MAILQIARQVDQAEAMMYKKPDQNLHLNFFLLFLSRHLRAIRQSIKRLSVLPSATFITFAVIGIALALPMGLFVLLTNIHNATLGFHETTSQISLYLNHDASQSQADDLMRILRANNDISDIKYISPKQGLEEFQKQSGFANIITELDTNPIPPVIVIYPKEPFTHSPNINELLTQLKNLPNVQTVQLDMLWLQRLNAIINLGTNLAYALIFLFAIGVILIVGNTIRLTMQKQKDEIKIINLLGGTNRFIRRPFLYSGIIYGLVGSIIAWMLIDLIMWYLQGPIQDLTGLYHSQFKLQGLNITSTLLLLTTGIILGYLGSWVTIGKQIKEIETL